MAWSYVAMLVYVAAALSALPRGARPAALLVHSRIGLALGGVAIVACAVAGALGALPARTSALLPVCVCDYIDFNLLHVSQDCLVLRGVESFPPCDCAPSTWLRAGGSLQQHAEAGTPISFQEQLIAQADMSKGMHFRPTHSSDKCPTSSSTVCRALRAKRPGHVVRFQRVLRRAVQPAGHVGDAHHHGGHPLPGAGRGRRQHVHPGARAAPPARPRRRGVGPPRALWLPCALAYTLQMCTLCLL